MAVPLMLRVFRGDQLVVSKEYDRDIIKIGRLSSAHLCLDDDRVSRIHSVIEVGPDGSLSIIDMGSVEGTFVNGKRVNKGALTFGDSIKLGNTLIKVEPAGVPAVAPAAGAVATAPLQVSAVSAVTLGAGAVAQAQLVRLQSPPGSPLAPLAAGAASGAFESSAQVRARPRRRLGTGPLGVEVRLLWGDQMVGEYFLGPGRGRTFRVGSVQGVDFELGDGKLGGPSLELVKLEGTVATVRFTSKMQGEYQRRSGEEIMTLEEARRRGVASEDGGTAFALAISADDFVWVDLGGVVAEVFFQPAPRPVAVPLTDSLDFTVLNIFLVCFFLAALFVISAANRTAEGEAFDDELNSNQARIAKLLIKPPENQKNPILERYEKAKASGEVAAKRKGEEGKMGKVNAPARPTRTAPKGDPTNKDQARLLLAKVFGGAPGGGVSTVFGHQGLGGELKSAMGGMFGTAPGDAAGLGGMGLRGASTGGGGLANSIGIGGISTHGKGGGSETYGSGVGVLTAKKDVDIGITASDPTVIGSLDKELIRKVIHANRNRIRYCYESQLNRFPNLEGKVVVKFLINGEGRVSQSNVTSSTAGNAELETCVAGRVRLLEFPHPKGGGVVVVSYPFLFKQSGQ